MGLNIRKGPTRACPTRPEVQTLFANRQLSNRPHPSLPANFSMSRMAARYSAVSTCSASSMVGRIQKDVTWGAPDVGSARCGVPMHHRGKGRG